MLKFIVDGKEVMTSDTVYGVGHKGNMTTLSNLEETLNKLLEVLVTKKTGFIKKFGKMEDNFASPSTEMRFSRVSAAALNKLNLDVNELVDVKDAIDAFLPWSGYTVFNHGEDTFILNTVIRTTISVSVNNGTEAYLFEIREVTDAKRFATGLSVKIVVDKGPHVEVKTISNLSQRDLIRYFTNYMEAEAELTSGLLNLGYVKTDKVDVLELHHDGKIVSTIDFTLKSLHQFSSEVKVDDNDEDKAE